MSMPSELRMCGIDIPYAEQFNGSTANQIHSMSKNVQKNALIYNSGDIEGTLTTVVNAANGILKAIDSGQVVDINNTKLDEQTVKAELITLSEDLRTLSDTVEQVSKSDKGQARWESATKGSLEGRIKDLKSLADKMSALAK